MQPRSKSGPPLQGEDNICYVCTNLHAELLPLSVLVTLPPWMSYDMVESQP